MADLKGSSELRIPLESEGFAVSRREIEKSKVEISLITETHDRLVDEELTRVRVEIDRVPICREIDETPQIRQEGDTTIIPVVEEVIVVERRLVLKEEIRVRRICTAARHQETVVLREQNAVVTRTEADSNLDQNHGINQNLTPEQGKTHD